MKKLLIFPALIFALGASAAGQAYRPCITHVPETGDTFLAVTAETRTIKLNGGAIWWLPFMMPARGHCVGEFSVFDDRSDLWTYAQDAAGRRVGVPIKPAGDIEIMILTPDQLRALRDLRSYTALFTTERSYGGTFDWELPYGRLYYLVVSNRHSVLAGKSVTLSFGGVLDDPIP